MQRNFLSKVLFRIIQLKYYLASRYTLGSQCADWNCHETSAILKTVDHDDYMQYHLHLHKV